MYVWLETIDRKIVFELSSHFQFGLAVHPITAARSRYVYFTQCNKIGYFMASDHS